MSLSPLTDIPQERPSVAVALRSHKKGPRPQQSRLLGARAFYRGIREGLLAPEEAIRDLPSLGDDLLLPGDVAVTHADDAVDDDGVDAARA